MLRQFNRHNRKIISLSVMVSSFYERLRRVATARNVLIDELNALTNDPNATPADFNKLLPRCVENDRAYAEFLIVGQNLEEWVLKWIVHAEESLMVNDHNLMRSKLNELLDDPSMTDAKWKE